MNPSTKRDTSLEDWRFWCRLCAKSDTQDNIDLFAKNEYQTSSASGSGVRNANRNRSLLCAIDIHFLVNIRQDDDLPSMLCSMCFSLVTSLEAFSERVSKVQQMFKDLQSWNENSKLDYNVIRLKYGLMDEIQLPVLMHQHKAVSPAILESETNEDEDPGFETISVQSDQFEDFMHQLEPVSGELNLNWENENAEEPIFEAVSVQSDPFQNAHVELPIKEEIILEERGNENAEESYESDDSERDSSCALEFAADDTEGDDCNPPEPLRNNKTEEYQPAGSSQTLQKEQTDNDLNTKANETELEDRQDFKVLKCPQCTKLFLKPSLLNSHMNSHVPLELRRIFACPLCDKTFSTELVVERHVKQVHHADLPFKCEKCPRKYITQNLLDSHLGTHIKRVPVKFKCPQCSSEWSRKWDLKKHMRSHVPDKLKRTNACPHCDKKYVSAYTLKLHINHVHLNERPFVCEECGLGLGSAISLKEHMVRHTDETPFECQVCKQKIKSKHRLKIHMRSHNPNKFPCSKCGVELKTRPILNGHMKSVHGEIKRFKCDYCGRTFRHCSHFKFHLMQHCDIKPFSCNFCALNFSFNPQCRTHAMKEHPKELAAKSKYYTYSAPKLEALKAIAKTAKYLTPVRERAPNKPKHVKTHAVSSAISDSDATTTTDAASFSDE